MITNAGGRPDVFDLHTHKTPLEDIASFIGHKPEFQQKAFVEEYLEGAIEWLDNGHTVPVTDRNGRRDALSTYDDIAVTLSELISSVGEGLAEAERGPDEIAVDNGW